MDTKNIADYLMCAFDGFVDIVEIKRPNGSPILSGNKRSQQLHPLHRFDKSHHTVSELSIRNRN